MVSLRIRRPGAPIVPWPDCSATTAMPLTAPAPGVSRKAWRWVVRAYWMLRLTNEAVWWWRLGWAGRAYSSAKVCSRSTESVQDDSLRRISPSEQEGVDPPVVPDLHEVHLIGESFPQHCVENPETAVVTARDIGLQLENDHAASPLGSQPP